MSDPLPMSCPPTLPASSNVTGSPASRGGHTLFDLRAYQTADQCGRDRLLASLSPRRAAELGLMTSGTYGQHSITMSASADLQKSLESRLQATLSTLGSTLYRLTWKAWATPSGRSRSRLRASVPRISATDATGAAGWVTPTSRDWKDSGSDIKPRSDTGKERLDQLPRQANLAGWPTPMSGDGPKGGPGQNPAYLTPVAHLAGWPTPIVNDSTGSTHSYSRGDHDKKILKMTGTAQLAGWPTPSCNNDRTGNPDSAMSMKRADGSKVQQRLQDFAVIAGWETLDGPARLTASGKLLTGSHAGMESGGLLHPAHSLWLMGYPIEWLSCGARAMQSMSTPRKRSSKRSTGATE